MGSVIFKQWRLFSLVNRLPFFVCSVALLVQVMVRLCGKTLAYTIASYYDLTLAPHES